MAEPPDPAVSGARKRSTGSGPARSHGGGGREGVGHDGDWGRTLAAVLDAPDFPDSAGVALPVAAIGERARELLASATRVTSGKNVACGPVYPTLNACLAAPASERGSGCALLTLDALEIPVGAERTPGVLEHALGSASRCFPARLLLFVRADEAPVPETLFAFGFRRRVVAADGELHEYRLSDYKTPPDWLNARFWANPERFELDPDESGDADDDGDEYEDDDDDEDDEEEE